MIGFRNETIQHSVIVMYILILEKFSSSTIFLLLTTRWSVLKNRGIRMQENIDITITLLKFVGNFCAVTLAELPTYLDMEH